MTGMEKLSTSLDLLNKKPHTHPMVICGIIKILAIRCNQCAPVV